MLNFVKLFRFLDTRIGTQISVYQIVEYLRTMDKLQVYVANNQEKFCSKLIKYTVAGEAQLSLLFQENKRISAFLLKLLSQCSLEFSIK